MKDPDKVKITIPTKRTGKTFVLIRRISAIAVIPKYLFFKLAKRTNGISISAINAEGSANAKPFKYL